MRFTLGGFKKLPVIGKYTIYLKRYIAPTIAVDLFKNYVVIRILL